MNKLMNKYIIKSLSTLSINICLFHSVIEEKISILLLKINKLGFYKSSLFIFLIFNFIWMGITFLLDITMIILLSIYYIIKQRYYLIIKLFVNEVLDIILFMFLLYKLTYYYFFFYWTYKSLKFLVNNELPKIKSVCSVLTYLDSFLISSIESNKVKISNKLLILTENC